MSDPSLEILFTEDHERIDALWEKYLESRQNGSALVPSAFKSYRTALENHMRCEEELIFPVLERNPVERSAKEVPTLMEEHLTIRELLSEIESLFSRPGIELSQKERHLFEALHEHNAREEMSVYPDLERLVETKQTEAARERLISRASV